MFEHIQRKDNGDFPYQFAKKATTCPQCGKKRFKPYINIETGEMLPSQYGRCNRQDHCGYWLDPYKDGYGRLLPDEWKAKRAEQTKQRNYIIPKPQPAKPVSFIDNATFNKSLAGYDNNTLINGLCQIAGQERVMRAVELYRIGTTKDGATIFWQLDADNNVRTGKVIHYKPDLHRNKDVNINWAHTALKLPDFHLQQCLFGLHLLAGNNMPVAIAESEKTAVVASMYIPEYVWLATGGKGNFALIDKAAAAGYFDGRKVILFPDLGATAGWESKAQELRSKCKIDIYVSDWLEQVATEQGREQGADIADFLLRTPLPKATAEPQPATPPEMPAIERLQPDTIKSIAEPETTAEAKETAQNMADEVLKRMEYRKQIQIDFTNPPPPPDEDGRVKDVLVLLKWGAVPYSYILSELKESTGERGIDVYFRYVKPAIERGIIRKGKDGMCRLAAGMPQPFQEFWELIAPWHNLRNHKDR